MRLVWLDQILIVSMNAQYLTPMLFPLLAATAENAGTPKAARERIHASYILNVVGIVVGIIFVVLFLIFQSYVNSE